ncbi:hypothetical protein D3C71_448870 [compost metagenome]
MQEPELKIGDWVSSEDAKGNVYTGWIEDFPQYFPTFVGVWDVHLQLIAAVPKNATVRLPNYLAYEHLQQLADLALELKDREWFLQITEEMQLYGALNQKESEIHAKR